jgi:hypothetical protein
MIVEFRWSSRATLHPSCLANRAFTGTARQGRCGAVQVSPYRDQQISGKIIVIKSTLLVGGFDMWRG